MSVSVITPFPTSSMTRVTCEKDLYQGKCIWLLITRSCVLRHIFEGTIEKGLIIRVASCKAARGESSRARLLRRGGGSVMLRPFVSKHV